ncbi:hypothetical protein IWW36_001879 [Coemansia brasiliensis]|uniref:TOG domain-containing protein n=1 Tax=Coemansia brasiliensis TaxID=2650707 RepID=A0A9W8I872_9FUNG|nr:hypothetical protein IWW36_001879 [Coemansia brasiliensis]
MADEEDYSSLPLEQRLEHKIWKVRMKAYTDLAKEFKQLDPEREASKFAGYENLLAKMVLDSNMAAQESGVQAVIAFVDNAPNPIRRREEIVAGVVAKCLAATKAGTRSLSKELLLLLSEVDTPGPVVQGVLEGFEAKQPKAVVASLSTVRDIVQAFGIKFINLKQLLKALSKPFAHRDNGVRTEAQHVAVELYRWMGQAIMPSLQDLPPVLLKELESQFAQVAQQPPPKQERLLRSQQQQEQADAPSEPAQGEGQEPNDADTHEDMGVNMDPWDLADPVDIAQKLPDDFNMLMGSKKWKERKEALEQLHETLKKSIRLQMSSGTGDVVQELGNKISDTNIIVATLAIQNLELVARGLRQPFAPYVQSTLPALVEKSKERKQSVVDAIRATMDAYFVAAVNYDFTAIGDHYFTGATHKNPQARAEAHRFLSRCFTVVPKRPSKGEVKKYADQLKSGLDDGDAGVREAAAEGLGTLSKLVTAKVLDPFIEGVDKIKMEKINEFAEKATVKAKSAATATVPRAVANGKPRPQLSAATAKSIAPAGTQAPAAAAVAADNGSGGLGANLPPHIRKKLEASARAAAIKKAQREGRPIDDLLPPAQPEMSAPAAKPAVPRPTAASAAPKRPAAASAASSRKPATTTTAAAAPAAVGKAKSAASEAVTMRYANDESLDEKIAEVLPADILTNLGSAKWKERMEAMDQLKEFLGDEAARSNAVHAELVVRQLGRKPGWKESNFQVTLRSFQLIGWMAEEDSVEFNTGAVALAVPALVDKLGDIKLKTASAAALVAMAERFTLQLVIGQAIEPIRGQKSPKVIADCLTWLNTQLIDFGVQGVRLRMVVDVVRDMGLQSSNAQTRATAVTLMGTLRRAAGPAILDLAGDLNSQLIQLLEAEFTRVGEEKLPDPKRTQRGLASAGSSSGKGSSGVTASTAGSTDDAMDDLFPRQDLQALLGAGIYKQLGDSNWKERKAGLEAIQGALAAANNRIQPNVPGDLYVALKLRLTDPNKNLVTVALAVLGGLSQASGAALVPNIRLVALPTMHCLADKKPQLRTAALAAMTAWAEANSHSVDQAIVPALPTALGDSSPELRTALLRWTADTLTKHARLPDLSGLITPLFSCLQDRTAEVRKQATRVLGLVVKSCGFETVHDACSLQLRGAARTTVSPIIEEFRATAAAAAAEHTPARRTPAPAAVRPARAESPAAEPVMTASELLGRAPPPAPAPAAPTPTASAAAPAGPRAGVLRRPMAVRRPTGSAQGPPSVVPRGASGLGRMSAEELAHVAPVVDSDERAKEQRARRDAATSAHGAPRWAQLGDARVRTELEAQLREQAVAHMNPLVCRQLFSTGHYRDRDHLAGLTALDEAVDVSEGRFNLALHGPDSLAARYAAHVDLLLKYTSLRMYDGSTHTLLKSFDLLERLAQLAVQTNTRWSEYEVQAIVPALISRLGDAKEAVRVRARRILTQQFPQLHAPARLFAALVDHGVGNRTSARVRQEALDCVRTLLGRERASAGLSAVCAQPARAVPVFAQAVGDRDSAVRAAALHVLVTLAEQLPGGADDLWRLCGRMPEKERTMLEERLRRSALPDNSRPSSSIGRPASGIGRPLSSIGRPGSSIGRPMPGIGRPVPVASAHIPSAPMPAPLPAAPAAPAAHKPTSGASRPMFSLDFDNLSLPAYSAATSEQLGASGSRPNSDTAIGFNAGRSERLRAALHDSQPSTGSSDRECSVGAAIGGMRSADAALGVERMHALVRALNSETSKALQAQMGSLCEAAAVVLQRASASPADGLRRSLLALLMDVFGEQQLALWAPQSGVRELLRELVATLVDPRLSPSASAEGAQLHRAVNALVVRIMDRSDRTAVVVALVALLDAAAHTPLPQPPSSPADVLRADAGDIVMRCLWRLSKHLPQDLKAQFAGCADATSIPSAAAYPAVGDLASCRALRVDAVLLTTHRFFRHTPNREWRRREDQDRWTFGDLPKRTVKTISHSLVLALRSAVWQFVTPLLRDVMRASPNLLPAAPASGPSAAWVDAVHSAMVDASEAWEYLARALRDANSPDCPRPQQLYDAFIAAANSRENTDEDDLDTDSVAPFGIATHSPSLGRPSSRTSVSSMSPHLQQQRVLHGTSSPDRTRSPISLRESSSSYIPTSAARSQTSTQSSFERLKALRDRIGGTRPQQYQQQQHPSGRLREIVTSSAVSSRSISPTSSSTAASPDSQPSATAAVSERRREHQQQQPAPSISDIRERINMMRNSLRNGN